VLTTVLYVPSSLEHRPVAGRLAELGLPVVAAGTAAEIVRLLARRPFTLALVNLTDDRGPLMAIRSIRAQRPDLYIAGLMDPARPLVAAEAMRAGVSDLLAWPLDAHDVAAAVANAVDRSSVEAPDLRDGSGAMREALFANSPSMRTMMERVRSVAAEHGGVLLCGERGSGRELVARAIHARSARADHAFVVVDCGAGALHDIELRLFGLVSDRRASGPERRGTERVGVDGAVFRAQGGTLLLQNLVDAPSRVQTKLARLLRDGEAALAEERSVVDLDFRPIASVDFGMDTAIADERLRRDLYDCMASARLEVPPLRRRREDIPLIAVSLLRETCEKSRVPVKTCSRAALVMLAALPWPGNGRELRTLVESLVKSVPRPVIQLDDLFEHVRLDGLAARVEAGATLRDARARFERDWISAVLMKHHGRMGEAAKALGIQRTNLYRKVRQLKVARSPLGPRRQRI
jgi:DNA-binding NtrC family response regulator